MAYHNNDELAARLHAAETAASAHAETFEIGYSVEDRPIHALRIAAPGRTPSPTRRQALITANIHGNEVIASELALHLIGRLCAPAPTECARQLLDLADVTVVPAINVDLRQRTAAALNQDRWWLGRGRANRHGVDLNRNFPPPAGARDAWHTLAGSRFRVFPWFRGPAPLSEPESAAIAQLAEQLRPVAALGLHATGGLVLYPPCHSAAPPPDVELFRAMGEKFVAAQRGQRYRVKQSHAWYAILGDLDDWLYASFGTLAMTVELGWPMANLADPPARVPSMLSWFNPRKPDLILEQTAEACLQALLAGVEARDRLA
jgi:predicted deacylase